MRRRYLSRRPCWIIRVTFASGAVVTYGPFEEKRYADDLLASRWATLAPDPHDKYADVLYADVLKKRVPRPMRPPEDLLGRRFVQA